MINITIDCATGAEAREQLMALLGATDGPFTEIAIKDEKIAKNFEIPKTEVVKEEIPAGKKRRTKAEIEAEKNGAPAADEIVPEGADIQEEAPVKEEPKASAITKEMLQEKAVNLIRNGKKAEVTETIKKFGADSISQADKNPVKTEDYAALMDAFNAIG